LPKFLSGNFQAHPLAGTYPLNGFNISKQVDFLWTDFGSFWSWLHFYRRNRIVFAFFFGICESV